MKLNLEQVTFFIILFLIISTFISNFLIFVNLFYWPLVLFPAVLLSVFITKSIKIDWVKNDLKVLILLIALLVIYICSTTSLIFSFDGTDVSQHLSLPLLFKEKNGVGLQEKSIGPFQLMPHAPHFGTFSLYSFIFQIIPLNFMQTATLFSIFLNLLSFLVIYFVSFRIFKKKSIGIISAFLYSFSIIPFWIIEQGYIHQLVGTLFFMFFFYAFFLFKKNFSKKFLMITILSSGSVLLSYPHIFILIFLFLLVYLLFTNKKRQFLTIALIIFISSIAISSFEWIHFIFPGGDEIKSNSRPLDSLFAETGFFFNDSGALNPNPLMFLPFFPVIVFSIYLFLKTKSKFIKKYPVLFTVSFSIFLLLLMLLSAYLLNFAFKWYPRPLYRLYYFVKFFYVFVQPLSIICAFAHYKIKNQKFKKIMIALFIFHLLYIIGYSGYLNNRGLIFPVDFYFKYESARQIIKPGFEIGVDSCIMEKDWPSIREFPFNLLADRPANTTFIKLARLNKLFNFEWTEIVGLNAIDKTSKKPVFDFSMVGVAYSFICEDTKISFVTMD